MNMPFNLGIVTYEKDFDSIDMVSLWKLMKHCGITKKIINLRITTIMIRNTIKMFEVKNTIKTFTALRCAF